MRSNKQIIFARMYYAMLRHEKERKKGSREKKKKNATD